MKIKNLLFPRFCFRSLNKQQATDKLHFLIDSNYWSVNESLPDAHELPELLDCDLNITTQAIYRLICAGVIFKRRNGRLFTHKIKDEKSDIMVTFQTPTTLKVIKLHE